MSKRKKSPLSTCASGGCGCLLLLGLSIAILVWIERLPKATPPTYEAVDANTQAERRKLLDGYGREGVVASWSGGDHAELRIRPGFYALSFDSKQTLANLAYAYLYELPAGAKVPVGEYRVLLVTDDQTNTAVGTFEPHLGLRLD